jgi:dTDP-4-amino-4,6-dideoxygalactose transaminase
VLVVHFQGAAAEMERIQLEAHRRGLFVIEDCAESPGATYRGRRVGTWSDAAIFSFQHNKPMTAGEGGLVVTRDLRLYERAVRLHDLGQYRPYHAALLPPSEPAFVGGQARMSELTAAVALAQLRKLDRIRDHCRMLKDRIVPRLAALPHLTLRPLADPGGDFGFEVYFYVRDAATATRFREALAARQVWCQQRTGTYPQYHRDYVKTGLAAHPALHPFRDAPTWPAPGYRPEDFPVTEDLTQRFVALPLGWHYTPEDADYIATCVEEVARDPRGLGGFFDPTIPKTNRVRLRSPPLEVASLRPRDRKRLQATLINYVPLEGVAPSTPGDGPRTTAPDRRARAPVSSRR